MSSAKRLTCHHPGCTFQARDRLGKRNREAKCTFSVPKKRILQSKANLIRRNPDDSDCEEQRADTVPILPIILDADSYASKQHEIKKTWDRLCTNADPIEEIKKDREERDVSKCELAAMLLSEIGHKAWKEKLMNCLPSSLPSSISRNSARDSKILIPVTATSMDTFWVGWRKKDPWNK